MSDECQPIGILLDNMRHRLARGGMTYAEAVTLEDIVTTIEDSIRQAAEARETSLSGTPLSR